MSGHEPDTGSRGLTRGDLEAVVRRAAELSAVERDADERLTPDEVLRIASELGLQERYARQALYELEGGVDDAPILGGRYAQRRFGPGVLQCGRVVADPPSRALARLEEYLVSREYLQLRRRTETGAWLEPADDTVSTVTRALNRLSRRLHLSRAERVRVSARTVEEGSSYVRLDLDFGRRRKQSARTAVVVGGGAGTVAGGLVFSALGAVGLATGSPEIGIAAGAVAGLGTAAGTAAAFVRAAAARFRRNAAEVLTEAESLLDRLERGERLEPPAAPWLRRIRSAADRRLPPGR